MRIKPRSLALAGIGALLGCLAAVGGLLSSLKLEHRAEAAGAQNARAVKKPNIILLVSDDTGWGDLGPNGGGEGRGMATPNFDRMARQGMQFWSFYGQPSCTPGRADLITGRIPNRSGMTTVAFPGQGGGLPKEEWGLASVLKRGGYIRRSSPASGTSAKPTTPCPSPTAST